MNKSVSPIKNNKLHLKKNVRSSQFYAKRSRITINLTHNQEHFFSENGLRINSGMRRTLPGKLRTSPRDTQYLKYRR